LHHVKRGEQVVIEETSTWLKKWVDDTVGDQLAILDGHESAPSFDRRVRAAVVLAGTTPKPTPRASRRPTRPMAPGRGERTSPSGGRFNSGIVVPGDPIMLVVKYRRDGPWARGSGF
jgi:hypothetical protein